MIYVKYVSCLLKCFCKGVGTKPIFIVLLSVKPAQLYNTVHTRAGALHIFQVRLLMMKPLQKPHTIRKQLSSSNLFMSDMLFLMKALAALHNQLAISELIFHPAIVMSSLGAGIIHNSLCYDKLRPQAREVYERFWAHVKSVPFVLE